MKKNIKWLFLALLIISSNLFAQTSSVESWEQQIFMSQTGSCEGQNLNFRALRFTKIPLISENNNLFLRIILFVRPDNTLAIRTTIQELITCQTSSSGSEICSYRPISNSWAESSWNKNNLTQNVDLDHLGNIHFENSELSIHFSADYEMPEVAGKNFNGSMVLVNFDDHGVNTANLCKSLQKILP